MSPLVPPRAARAGLVHSSRFSAALFSTALQHDHHRLWRFFVDTISTSPHNFLVRFARNFSRLRELTPTLVSGWLLGDGTLCPFCRARLCNASIQIVKQGVAGSGLSKSPRNNARAAARAFVMSARPLRLAIIFAHARWHRVLHSARISPAPSGTTGGITSCRPWCRLVENACCKGKKGRKLSPPALGH